MRPCGEKGVTYSFSDAQITAGERIGLLSTVESLAFNHIPGLAD
jgi:hypothetical protein